MLNGENYKTLVQESNFNRFQILDNDIYFREDNKLMKMSLDDLDKKEEVTDKINCEIYNVTTNGIYYLDKSNLKIYYISLKGQNQREIVSISNNNTKINIIDNNILYYVDKTEDGKTVTQRVNTRGKKISAIKY